MGDLLPKQRAEAARLGWLAVAGWGGTGLVLFFVKVKLLALIGAAAAVWLTWRWFKYRASWGMRF